MTLPYLKKIPTIYHECSKPATQSPKPVQRLRVVTQQVTCLPLLLQSVPLLTLSIGGSADE